MQPKEIIAPRANTAQEHLAVIYPEELRFFKETFLWTGCTKGCYVRYGYEPQIYGDAEIPKWCPFRTRGRWQPLYSELVDSLAEKHLDFNRFVQTHPEKDRLRPRDWETAFWVGTMAGIYTRTHCLDIDAHDIIGWYYVPTRWHMSRTGWGIAPYEYRDIPVIRPNMRFFATAKVVYEHFPNRIWAFSSGNLGLSVWKVFGRDEVTETQYRKAACVLRAVGLSSLEHYPCPSKSPNSLGKCHRRPCGLDSGIITPTGVITDPIEQIRWFMRPRKTPTFEQILAAYWDALGRMYAQFMALGEGLDHSRLSVERKRELVEGCWETVEQVKGWARDGCPVDKKLLEDRPVPSDTKRAELVPHMIINGTGVGGWEEKESDRDAPLPSARAEDQDAVVAMFQTVDLPAIVETGRWAQFVKFLVENGIPAEDKFYDVISTLAKWFAFVEFYGRPPEDTKEVLHQYVVRKHNDKVSRLNNGEVLEVLSHVDRIVDHVLAHEDREGHELFADLRRRRSEGLYADVWYFAPQIIDGIVPSSITGTGTPASLAEPEAPDHAHRSKSRKWKYEPDDTPLPDFVVQRIREAFRLRRRQLRRNKQGRYATLDAITRLFNYLLAGRKPGERRASQKLLIKMGFPSSGKKREPIMRVLEKEDLLRRGPYRALSSSRLWTLVDADKYAANALGPIDGKC